MEAVRHHLQSHVGLVALLIQVFKAVRQEFGEPAEPSVEVYADPVIDDPYLTLYVRQPVYEPTILARIEAVCAAFDELLAEQSSWLLVTTDFRPPAWKHRV